MFGEDIAYGAGTAGINRNRRDDADDESPEQALRRIVGDLAFGDDPWAFAGCEFGRWGHAQICRTGLGRRSRLVDPCRMLSSGLIAVVVAR